MNAEHLPHQPERPVENEPATAESSAERAAELEQLSEAGHAAAEQQPRRAAEARRAAERLAAEPEIGGKAETPAGFAPGEKTRTKKTVYKQTLGRIQSQLPSRRSRSFSKLIHRPTVETVSEVAAKTLFRPSFTLGISLGALLGGGTLYVIARRYGFTLSGSEFLLTGLAGGAIGVVLEVIFKLTRRLFKRSPNY